MPLIIYEKENHVVTMTINRPESYNAFDMPTEKEFADSLTKFNEDPEAWVAIVTGAGDKAFSAGYDLKKLELPEEEKDTAGVAPVHIMRGMHVYKPIIAAINGMALGGGMECALACDMRVAAETATLGLPEVKWNLMPGWGGTQRLPRLVPWAKAIEILLTGKSISAQEAYRIGLVNYVVPQAELMTKAKELAGIIAQNGPVAVRTAKEALYTGIEMPLDDALTLEWKLVDRLLPMEDTKEGVNAFRERRKPNYAGK